MKMKSLILAAAFVAAILPQSAVHAQDDPPPPPPTDKWLFKSNVDLALTQSGQTKNWAGSETGALAWTLNSITVAEKQILTRMYNQNTLKLAYGLTYTQDRETRAYGRGDITTDLIDLESTFRMTLGTFVEPILALRGISRFRDRREHALPDTLANGDPIVKTDQWINPIQLTQSLGVAKVFVKEETREIQARLGFGARQTIDRDQLDLTTGSRETLTQYDTGFDFVADLRIPMADDKVEWLSKLTVFQATTSSVSDDDPDDLWAYPDVNFENTFTTKVTKYIAVNLYIQLLYDRQVDRDARIRQTLTLGLTYNLL